MKTFLVLLAVSLLIFLVFLVAYAPVVRSRLRIKAVKRALVAEIDALDDVFEKSCMVITDPLGVGGSKNSGIRFSKASENLDVAVSSSRALIANMKITRD